MAKQTSMNTNVPAAAGKAAGPVVADPLHDSFESRLVSLWLAWGKRAAIVVALLAVVIILAAVWRQQRADRIAGGYAAIKAADSADKLAMVANEHRGSAVGAQAAFAQAKRLFDDGKFEEAAGKFAAFCKDFPQDPLVTQASLGEAYATEAAGKAAVAEKKFAAIAKSVKDVDTMADAYLAAGRCAESQGKAKEAEGWYKSAVSSGATGTLKEKALSALKRFSTEGK